MTRPDFEGELPVVSGSEPDQGSSTELPIPIEVCCERCGGIVKFRLSDGLEYHEAGEPGDEHRPIPVVRR